MQLAYICRMDGRLIYNLSVWAVVTVLLILCLRQCELLERCGEGGAVVSIQRDTVYVPDTVYTSEIHIPKPRFTRQQLRNYIANGTLPVRTNASSLLIENDTVPSPWGESRGAVTVLGALETPCTDTVFYTDTLARANDYTAILQEQVSGNQIVGRRFQHYNTKPATTITETITKQLPPKPETVRVYLGLMAGFSKPYGTAQWNWNVGPEVLLTTPIGLAANYSYDAKNNGHSVGLMYKIKLRK